MVFQTTRVKGAVQLRGFYLIGSFQFASSHMSHSGSKDPCSAYSWNVMQLWGCLRGRNYLKACIKLWWSITSLSYPYRLTKTRASSMQLVAWSRLLQIFPLNCGGSHTLESMDWRHRKQAWSMQLISQTWKFHLLQKLPCGWQYDSFIRILFSCHLPCKADKIFLQLFSTLCQFYTVDRWNPGILMYAILNKDTMYFESSA